MDISIFRYIKIDRDMQLRRVLCVTHVTISESTRAAYSLLGIGESLLCYRFTCAVLLCSNHDFDRLYA